MTRLKMRFDNCTSIYLSFLFVVIQDSYNCTRESLTFYPRDWPYEDKVQRFCGKSLPGNGHLYCKCFIVKF